MSTNLFSPFASKPSPGTSGNTWKPTDAPYNYIDNGVEWDKYLYGQLILNPPTFGWTWLNQDVWDVVSEFDHLKFSNNGGSNGLMMYYRDLPSIPYKVTVAIIANPPISEVEYSHGIGLLSSIDGKITTFESMYESGHKFGAYKWVSPTGFDAPYLNRIPVDTVSPLLFLRIEDDGTDRKFSTSYDGLYFNEVLTVPNDDFHVPDKIGVIGITNPMQGNFNIVGWKEE